MYAWKFRLRQRQRQRLVSVSQFATRTTPRNNHNISFLPTRIRLPIQRSRSFPSSLQPKQRRPYQSYSFSPTVSLKRTLSAKAAVCDDETTLPENTLFSQPSGLSTAPKTSRSPRKQSQQLGRNKQTSSKLTTTTKTTTKTKTKRNALKRDCILDMNAYYFQHYGIPYVVMDCVKTQPNYHDNSNTRVGYTATFECPVTHQEYSSDSSTTTTTTKGLATQALAQVVMESKNREELDHKNHYYSNSILQQQQQQTQKDNDDNHDRSAASTTSDLLENDDDNSTTAASTNLPPPTNKLHAYYRQQFDINLNKHIEVLHDGTMNVYTATLHCPVTNTVFGAGRLRQNSNNNNNVEEKEDTPYYLRKRDAKAAVCGHLLDLIQFASNGTLEPRYCHNDPSLFTNQPLPLPPAKENQSQRPSRLAGNDLNLFYLHNHQKERACTYIETTCIQTQPTSWTATFKCPVTGHQFPAGTLMDAESYLCRFVKGSTPDAVFYSKKAIARRAAAARALDVLHYLQLDDDEQSRPPRFCKEDPAVLAGRLKAVAHDESQQRPSLSSALAEIELKETSSPEDDEDDSDLLLTESDNDLNIPQEEETPTCSGFEVRYLDTNSRQRPLDRIIKSASRRMDSAQNPVVFSGESPRERLIRTRDAMSRLLQSLRGSDDKEIHRNPHRLLIPSDERNALSMGKGLLAQLADAYQSLERPHRCNIDIEKEASQMMNFLWSSENQKPSSATYRSFLCCLQGPDAVKVARRALSVYDKMENRDRWRGNVLPRPDIHTTNAVIQLQAQTGRRSPLYNAVIVDDFQPNAETFCCALSYSTYAPSNTDEVTPRFDVHFVRECLSRMKEIGTFSDQEMSRAFNAPLRWAGGPFARASRPYARPIPFDDYSSFYSSGIRDDPINVFHEESLEYASYIQQNERNGYATIDTYEALIQSWLRTKTLEGLKEAESIAERLITGCDRLPAARLLTFQPIVAAWLHARHGESAPSIERLIRRLLEASHEQPHIRPDERMINAMICSYAWKAMNEQEDSSNDDISTSSGKVLCDAAVRCTDLLTMFCVPTESNEYRISMEASAFTNCVRLWSSVLLAFVKEEKEPDIDAVYAGIANVIMAFESTLQSFGVDGSVPSEEFQRFIVGGDATIVELVRAMKLITEVDDKSDASQVVELTERAIRILGELYEMHRIFESLAQESDSGIDKWPPPHSLHCKDRFLYGKLDLGKKIGPTPLAAELVALLEKLPVATDEVEGAVFRICSLVGAMCIEHKKLSASRGTFEKALGQLLNNRKKSLLRDGD